MEHPVENYTLIHRVEDKKFSIDDLTHYSLLLLIGARHLQLCVTDTREGDCMIVEEYSLANTSSPEEQAKSLHYLFEGHHLLMAGYWKNVKLAVKNNAFALIPETFFSREKLSSYLAMSAPVDAERDGYYYYQHAQSEAVNVFAANKKLVESIRSWYPSLDVQVVHHGSAFIEGIQGNRDFTYYRDMYLHVDHHCFSVVITEDNVLLLYNQFRYAHVQDIVKYVLTVMQEMEMTQQQSRVRLWGNLPTQSEHFQVLYRYVRHLEYGNRPTFLKFSHAFDELPDHQYFDLYGLHLCE